jgi:hypothetical protein
MARVHDEQRALRRELLLVRAAAERNALAMQLDQLEHRSRTGLAGVLLRSVGGARRAGVAGIAAAALRLARAQPWLVPAAASGVMRIARSRPLRWLAVAALVGGFIWWRRANIAGRALDGAAVDAPWSDAAQRRP